MSELLHKDKSVVEIENRITKEQRIIYNMMLQYVFFELQETTTFTMSIETFQKRLGQKFVANYNQIRNQLHTLATTKLEFLIFDPEGKEKAWAMTHLFSYVEIDEGIISWQYSEFLKNKLATPEIFARLDLDAQKKLTSKHAVALYEFFCMKRTFLEDGLRDVSTGEISFENLKKLLGATERKSYLEWKIFNRSALKPALKDINENTEFKVDLKLIKKRRKIVAVKFILNLKTEKIPSSIEQALRILGIKNHIIFHLLETYTEEELKAVLKYHQNYHNHIENVEAWIQACLSEKWYLKTVSKSGNSKKNDSASTAKEWFDRKDQSERMQIYQNFLDTHSQMSPEERDNKWAILLTKLQKDEQSRSFNKEELQRYTEQKDLPF